MGDMRRIKRPVGIVEGREWAIYSKINLNSEACILIKRSNRINRKISM